MGITSLAPATHKTMCETNDCSGCGVFRTACSSELSFSISPAAGPWPMSPVLMAHSLLLSSLCLGHLSLTIPIIVIKYVFYKSWLAEHHLVLGTRTQPHLVCQL
jgi:hypothetical protein